MEDRRGQGELDRKMKTITALHPTGASGRRSEVAVLGQDSYPLNSEHWYQPLLLQTFPLHSLSLLHFTSMHKVLSLS